MIEQHRDWDFGLPAEALAKCEVELRLLYGQLADKERQIQRLLTIEREQAAEIARLQTLTEIMEAAASV